MKKFLPLNQVRPRSVVLICLAICIPLVIAIFATGVYKSSENRFATLILQRDISAKQASDIQASIVAQTSVSKAELLSPADAAHFLHSKSKVDVGNLGISVAELPSRIRIVPQLGFTFEHVAGDVQEILLGPGIETFVVPEKHDAFLAPASFALMISIILLLIFLPLGWLSLTTDLRLQSEESKRRIKLMTVFGRLQSEMKNVEAGRGVKEGLTFGVYSVAILLISAIGGHVLFPSVGIQFKGSMLIWFLVMSPLFIVPLISVSARRHVLGEFL